MVPYASLINFICWAVLDQMIILVRISRAGTERIAMRNYWALEHVYFTLHVAGAVCNDVGARRK